MIMPRRKKEPYQALGFVVLSIVILLAISGCTRKDEGAELVNASGISMSAAQKVLQKGADINTPSSTRFGWTPLISGIYNHKEDVVDFLIKQGANPNIPDNNGETPLVWAIKVWNSNTNLVAKLLKSGADPKVQSRFREDAFDVARTQSNALELLRILESQQKLTNR